MRVFVTGATGWIGTATVHELISAGHDVVGLARSDSSADRLRTAGAAALPGDLDDLESLRRGAVGADAIIHLANKHDWADPGGTDRAERAAVESMLEVVSGTDKAFLVANGLSGLVVGRAAVESDPSPAIGPGADRGGSENLVLDAAHDGVRGMAIRFAPSVHGHGDWGFVRFLADIAVERGVSGYIDEGTTLWSAVHRHDAARLIRLGIEIAPSGARLHAVAEQEISTRAIAEALGSALDVPIVSIAGDDADQHFGFMAEFFGSSMTGTSATTRSLTGWEPTQPRLIDDIRSGAYSGRVDR
ncbi:SDR family oxidoreductase [Williamsia sterculiae]|uniref:Nucleoside-diphosphate-sugar epimerase n=1 Tax=Williamsia sterculiae TaxID=1344003 RepID=A0A1N7H1F0_9NOCA|nr:SDR family oxidoreductase [Williamsia sterculiae]SIS18669.1 Nucleoside-diphosphate-sugar epimerase [Williamsia sterculiae]